MSYHGTELAVKSQEFGARVTNCTAGRALALLAWAAPGPILGARSDYSQVLPLQHPAAKESQLRFIRLAKSSSHAALEGAECSSCKPSFQARFNLNSCAPFVGLANFLCVSSMSVSVFN